MKQIKIYLGKAKIVDEKHEHELTQQEIREFRNRYETHNTWVAFTDKRSYPNNMDLIEYHFERREK